MIRFLRYVSKPTSTYIHLDCHPAAYAGRSGLLNLTCRRNDIYLESSPMQSLYLTEYIASDLFLTEIEKRNLPYEAILSDISYTSSSIPLFLLQHKPAADHLLHYRSNAIQQYDQILIIL